MARRLTTDVAYGNAVKFNGSTQAGRASVASTAIDDFTYCVWAKKADHQSDIIFSSGIDNGVNAFNGVSLASGGSATAWSAVFNGIGVFTGVTILAVDTWYHLAIVRNAGTSRLYVNGVDEGVTSTSTPNTPTLYTTIGSTVDAAGVVIPGKSWTGSVDDVRIYDRVLTAPELLAIVARAANPNLADASTTSLKAHWKLDETTIGTAVDSSGNNKTMTMVASPTVVTGKVALSPTATRTTSPARRHIRDFGTSLKFGGASTDKVVTTFTSHGTLRTYSAWVYRTGNGGGTFGRIFDKQITAGSEQLSSDGTLVYSFSRNHSTSGGAWTFPRPRELGWHHIVVTYDSSSVANVPVAYVNGASVTVSQTTAPVGTPVVTTDTYVIGNRGSDNGRNWAGHIDDFRIYNSILTATEVADLYRGIEPSTLPVFWNKFDEGSGTAAVDAGSGAASNGTITGATYSSFVPTKARTNSGTRTNA